MGHDPFAGDEWYGIGSVGGERLAFVGWVTALLAVAGHDVDLCPNYGPS